MGGRAVGQGVPTGSTPTPDPSPQGGGEEFAASLSLNLTPMGATLVVARFAHRVRRQQGDHKGRRYIRDHPPHAGVGRWGGDGDRNPGR